MQSIVCGFEWQNILVKQVFIMRNWYGLLRNSRVKFYKIKPHLPTLTGLNDHDHDILYIQPCSRIN